LSEAKLSPELQAELEELQVAKVVEKKIAQLPWVKRIWHVPEVQLLEEVILPIIPTPFPVPAEFAKVTLMESAKHVTIDRAKQAGYTGKGIKIAVVDSGVQKSHPMLEGKVIAERNFTSEPDPEDWYGHGTWCASCAVGNYCMSSVGPLEGMAPSALLINAKIFDATGTTTVDIAMAALEWACEQGAHILSNSWGGGPYDPLRDLIINLKETYGVIMVFAAGNSGPDSKTIVYPGGYPEVVCVGSVAVKNPSPDTIADFSSRGPNWQGDVKPDVMAPGGNGKGDYDECIYAAGLDGSVKCARGTSMATPHIAGGLALLLEAGLSATDAVAKLYDNAKDLVEPGKDNDSGWGTADFAKALDLPMPTPHMLSVTSTPIPGVQFYVDAETHLTPWTGELGEGKYRVSIASEVYVGGVLYRFINWEDGSTDPTRTINLVSDMSIVAYYKEIPTYLLSVDSEPFMNVPFTIDRTSGYFTPCILKREQGTYTVSFPREIDIDGQKFAFLSPAIRR